MASKQKLGQTLKQARKAKNLTQKQVAEKAGIHVNYYARIERGEHIPSMEVLKDVLTALDIKSFDLLDY